MARASTYTEEIASQILEQLTLGVPLRQICRDDNLPAASTVIKWADQRPDFRERYARARSLGLDAMAEEIIDIADDGSNDWLEREGEFSLNGEHVQRSKLRVDARKWLLSKMRPDKYGDRVAIAGDKENPIEVNIGAVELLNTRIDSILARSGTGGDTSKPE